MAFSNGYDGSMMNGLQTLAYWQDHFHHPSAATLGLLNAIFSVGQVVGLPFVPLLADGIGRKWTILLGSSLIFLGVILQTVSTTIGMFIAARFIIGLGICYTQSCSPMLITELSHPQYRGKLTTIYKTLWYSGSIVAAWTTYGTLKMESQWSWKTPSVLQSFPSVIQLFLICLVPESRKTFERFHAPSSGQEFVDAEYQEVLETMALENAGFFSHTAGAGIVSYYIFLVLSQIGITDSKDQLVLNGCLTIFNSAIAGGMAFTIDWIGRRPLFLTATFEMCLAMTGWTIASQQYSVTGITAGGRAVIALIFVFMFFYNLAWSGLLWYLTVTLLAVAAGSFFTNYVNPVALEKIIWKYYLCYIIWLAFQSVVVWWKYVETKGRSLEAVAICFDGDDAKLGAAGATGKGKELLDVLHTDGALGKGGIELQLEHAKV
ncbi:hypothetical protein LTR29_014143 [Friedmanniomyces endolithicus]|nr:hypothetical protein LTR29_014143 [Friedmanniomyces endolithicus]